MKESYEEIKASVEKSSLGARASGPHHERESGSLRHSAWRPALPQERRQSG